MFSRKRLRTPSTSSSPIRSFVIAVTATLTSSINDAFTHSFICSFISRWFFSCINLTKNQVSTSNSGNQSAQSIHHKGFNGSILQRCLSWLGGSTFTCLVFSYKFCSSWRDSRRCFCGKITIAVVIYCQLKICTI